MSIEPREEITESPVVGVDDPVWFSTLVRETAELDHTGVSAAVLSIRLPDDVDDDRQGPRIHNLLGRLVRQTDCIGQPSDRTFSVLLAPLDSITDTASQVHALTDALERAGFRVVVGFAHRRRDESLLDTWARAEAEADRAAYRADNRGGLVLSE